MSSRAIRRLREEREKAQKVEESEESEEEEEQSNKRAFLAMVDEETSSSEEEDDDDEQEEEDTEQESEPQDEMNKVREPDASKPAETEEDLDAILAEFETQDQENVSSSFTKGAASSGWFALIVAGMDARDLDIDYVMRTSLLGGTEDAPRASRRTARQFLFGAPRDEWAQHRPPHLVGGGLGMTTYKDDDTTRLLAWPYNQDGMVGQDEKNLKQWFTFLRSDTYAKDCRDYERIQQTGDVNALALYIAHHPFVAEPLLQLCMVLYQTNQSQEGLTMLRRCLWIYECSSLTSFAPLDTTTSCFMDYDQVENKSYFHALFRLVQVSGVAGCIRTSLAVSRYLLSLDPLRDPMGVLLLLDYYALATISEAHDHFVVDLVESQRIQIHYRDPVSHKHSHCDLVDLPNWSFSYALALYRLHESSDGTFSLERANEWLQRAIRKFPAVVEMLLDKNEVDVTGRSFQTDWASVMGKLRSAETMSELDPATHRSASAACDLMIRIFVQRNYKLWSSNHVLSWLYKNCVDLPTAIDSNDSIKAAFIRYRQVDPVDYEDRFRTLPQDANPLDPMLVGPALAIDPNRRR